MAAGCAEPPPSNVLRVSGHVEATEVRVAGQVGGRLIELRAAEGDRVAAGDVVGSVDTRDVELEIARAQAERATAAAQLRLLQTGSRPEDVRQAEAQTNALHAEIGAIDAELVAAEADRERFEALLAADAGSRKQRDDAAARVNVLQQRVRVVREQVRAAEQVVARLRSGARVEEIEAARTRVASIDAQIAVLRKRIDDATVVSPAGGIVTQVLVEQGEFVAPMMPMLVVTDIDRAWANLFVPEPAVPRLTIGQDAQVFTDAGGAGLPGTLTFVSPQAEFTPRNVQTADERSLLVYRIKVAVDNPGGRVEAGNAGRRVACAAMTSAIAFEGVAKRFGAVTALQAATFDVRPGEMFGLIGPDGAGKTTAIRLMCGLLRPDGGAVRVLGHDPVREHRQITAAVGYLSQRFSLYGDLTVDENIAFFAEVHGVAAYRPRRDELLQMTRLAPFATRLASRLSGGMKQKLALACTLVHEPQVLLLDEPTTGVDPVSRREFWKLLSECLSRGITVLMSTPYLDEAERCGRVALLHEGRLLEADTPSRIRARMPGRVIELAGPGMDADVVRDLPE